MNLTEAREQYLIVREKLIEAKTGLLNVSKRIAKAENTLQKHADAHALAVRAREAARDKLRAAATSVPSELAGELQNLCSLGPNGNLGEGAWNQFERARDELLQANRDVGEIERLRAEAKTVLDTGELERAEAHAEFLKWQKNAVEAAAKVERFLQVEVAGMAPQTQSQDAPLEIDPEIERPAPSGPESMDCQNPQ
jgi:hypothetical protein